MAAITNLSEIVRCVTDLTHVLDFDSRAHGRPLAEELFDIAAAGIQNRSLEQQKDPDGKVWAPNKGPYGKKKRRRGIKVGVGLYGDEVGGDMLEFEQLRGETVMTATGASMYYGRDEEDQQKMEWFTEGRPGIQAPRETYGIDTDTERRMDEAVDARLEQGIVDLGGA